VPAPEYPAVAKRFGYEGVVRVEIRIGADGTVQQAEVKATSGHGILDRHVRSTILSSWSFRPPGRETTVVKEFAFRLER
jgi:protein TonB